MSRFSLQGVQGISNQAMDIKMRQLKQDRQSIAKRHPKFYDIREQIRRSIEGKNKDDMKRGKTQVKSGEEKQYVGVR